MGITKGDHSMYKIIFYRDQSGREPVFEYLQELKTHSDKNNRINMDKINDYIQALSEHGTRIGEPFVKHLEDEIWELRPIRNRILFAAWIDGSFILLHNFVKKTQKTPKREIEQAKRNLRDFIERSR
jgi:phage-related protein